jgi:hypothetical protein
VALILAACSDNILVPLDPWGPLAVVEEVQGADGLASGTLRIERECVFLSVPDEEMMLLIWPADITVWDRPNSGILFQPGDAETHLLQDGLRVALGGGDFRSDYGNGASWIDSVSWVARPDDSCPMEFAWWVNAVVAAEPE